MSEKLSRTISRTEISMRVRGILMAQLGVKPPILEERSLKDHGLDAPKVAVLVAEVEYSFSCRISEWHDHSDEFAEMATLGQLIDLVEGGIRS